MESYTFTCITPEVRRLASFQRTPLPNHQRLSVSNSPAKLAKAGFMRKTDASKDEVCCESCGIVYGDWSGESPFAVHRILNEKCPILINTSAADDILQHPRVASTRRQLFPVNDPETGSGIIREIERNHVNSGDSVNEYSDGEEDNAGDNVNDDEQMTENDHASETNSINDGFSDSDDIVVPEPNSNVDNRPTLQSSPSQPAYVSVMSSQASYSFPFEPPVGGFSMLFASRRLKTFSDTGCPECVKWAEEGFVFRLPMQDVQCVFCTLILPFDTVCEPTRLHAEKSVSCPRVLLIDVGNISTADEEKIKLKNLQRQLKTKLSPDRHYTICYPQYEEENVRLGTYDNWPYTSYSSWDDHLHPTVMSQAGFYFTGFADKVKCYSCGVGVYRWRQGSDPWEQHARHMPACPHLMAKGHHFIQQAAQSQAMTEADIPTDTANLNSPDSGISSPGQLMTSPPGSLTLDMCAVTAALSTSQYTAQQVRHAVLTFFSHTSRFPTKDILLGTLKAADDNFTTVCQQREALHQKDSVIHQKDTALQQKDTALQQKDSVIYQKDTALQQKDTALQQKDTALQQKDTALQQKDTALQQTYSELQQKDQIIQHHQLELSLKEEELLSKQEELQSKEEELERRRREMSYQEAQIQSLRIQMQALLAERRRAGQQAAPLQAPAAQAAINDAAGDAPIMCDIRCKVCLSAESNTILQPCHHITCCSRCAHQLFSNGCPVCRAPIRHVLPAYIS